MSNDEQDLYDRMVLNLHRERDADESNERRDYCLGLLAWSVPVVLAVALLEAIVQWVTR